MRNRLITTLSAGAVLAAAAALSSLAAGPVRAQEPAAPKPEDVTPTPPSLTVNGALEVYYTYNFNRPGNNQYLYNYRDGQLGLNLFDLRVGKAATPTSRTGFLLRFIEGDVESATISPDDYKNILEAYGTVLVPLGGRDVKVDVGQFVTHVGYETIDIGTNNFFSRSFLFAIPPPFYNAGVRAAFPVSDRTTVTGFLLNRFNGLNDPGNRDIAPGFQIAQTLGEGSTLILNGLTSRENLGVLGDGETPGLNNKQQSILDLIYTTRLGATTNLAVEGLYRWGKTPADTSYDVSGIAGYATVATGGGNTLGLRGEYLKLDREFVGATDDLTLSSLTASYELRSGLLPGVRTLLELRYDRASDPYFLDRDGGASKKSQTSLTIGQAYSF
jgi:hypothetical protein